MNKRQKKKQQKNDHAAREAARQKVINGEALDPRERVAFVDYMENWLGNDTIRMIKNLFGGV